MAQGIINMDYQTYGGFLFGLLNNIQNGNDEYKSLIKNINLKINDLIYHSAMILFNEDKNNKIVYSDSTLLRKEVDAIDVINHILDGNLNLDIMKDLRFFYLVNILNEEIYKFTEIMNSGANAESDENFEELINSSIFLSVQDFEEIYIVPIYSNFINSVKGIQIANIQETFEGIYNKIKKARDEYQNTMKESVELKDNIFHIKEDVNE